MKTKSTIQTTGELRQFLVTTMLEVKSGEATSSQAQSIAKLAGHINENIYAEIKTARLIMDSNNKPDDLGEMRID